MKNLVLQRHVENQELLAFHTQCIMSKQIKSRCGPSLLPNSNRLSNRQKNASSVVNHGSDCLRRDSNARNRINAISLKIDGTIARDKFDTEASRQQTAAGKIRNISNELKPRKAKVPATSNRNTTAINTRLMDRNIQSNSSSLCIKPNSTRTVLVISTRNSSRVSQRLHSTKSLTRFEKHELLQKKEAQRQSTRVEIYAINKVLREAFEVKFAATMKQKRLEK